jgi:enoyl-CoA hydratase
MGDDQVLSTVPTPWGVRLVLDRPDKLNALNGALVAALTDAFDAAEANPEVRVIVIEGAGRAFSAGYDLTEEAEGAIAGPSIWRDLLAADVAATLRLLDSPKPVIAQVHGFCVGGGTDFALCSDLIVCAEDCRIGYPPARVWGSPTTSMWVYRLGLERTKRLLLTGDPLDGRTAVEWGLASEAVPADELDEAAMALARRVALLPANQLHMMKLLVNQAYEQMGLRVTQLIGTLLDGDARHTPEGVAFSRRARESVGGAVAERDAPFGDYGQRKR